MLTLIIVLIIKRAKGNIFGGKPFSQSWCKFAGLMCAGILICGPALYGQQQKRTQFASHFEVRHNGSTKGMMSVIKHIEGNVTNVRLESHFAFRMLIPMSVKAVEEASFTDGIMTFASIDRKVNGKQKARQKLMANGKVYNWTLGGNKTLPVYPIRLSVLSLYFEEPHNDRSVFSHALGDIIPLTKVKNGQYRLDFPNGNITYYNYAAGICTQVDVHHSMFHIQFLLVK